MPDEPLRPANREDALFAISYGLNTRHGHSLATTVAAEVVLAALEPQGSWYAEVGTAVARVAPKRD